MSESMPEPSRLQLWKVIHRHIQSLAQHPARERDRVQDVHLARAHHDERPIDLSAMSLAEQFQVVQPHQPDEPVRCGMNGEVDEFIFWTEDAQAATDGGGCGL